MVPGVGAKTARRLYDELGVSSLEELRAAAEQERIRQLKGLGPKAEENVLAALGKLADGAPAERLLLSRGAAGGRAARGRPSRPSRQRRGRGRRLGPAANRDLPRHRPDRHRQRAGGARRRRSLDHPLAATKGSSGEGGARITTHNGIAVDLRIVAPAAYGNLLQHFTGSAEHNIELRERAVGMELSVSEHGITDTAHRGGLPLRDRGRGLRAPRARLHRARAARGQRRDRRRGRRRAAGAGRRWRTFAATSTATPRSPTATTRSRRWPRPRGAAATPTSRSPTTPPATASATTSPPERLSGADPGGAGVQLGPSRLSAARRLGGQHPARRLARLRRTTCSPSSTGWWPASTPRSRSPGER